VSVARLRLVPTIGERTKSVETTNAALPRRQGVGRVPAALLKQHEDRLFVKYDNFSPPWKDFLAPRQSKAIAKAQAAESRH
jgi:hypothetical protein